MKVDSLALISLHTCPLAAPGQGKAGGMNVYLKELSQRIGGLGVKVDMFTRGHPGNDTEVVDLDDNVRLVHLDGGPPDLPMNAFFSHLPGFLEEIDRFRRIDGQNYDLVHSHYWMSGWVGARAARRWGVPHVVTFHTLMEIKARARVGEDDSPHRSEVERELMSEADLITASSFHEKSAMVRLYQAPEEKIRVLSCGVDLSLFKPLDMEESRKRLGLNGEKVILFVGRIEPIKGLDLLLQSVAEIDQSHIKTLIVGGNVDQEAEVMRLKEMAQTLGIEDSAGVRRVGGPERASCLLQRCRRLSGAFPLRELRSGRAGSAGLRHAGSGLKSWGTQRRCAPWADGIFGFRTLPRTLRRLGGNDILEQGPAKKHGPSSP